jgi:translation elongation factor EF-G
MILTAPPGCILQGVIDLVKMKAIIWSGEELGAKFDEVDIPEDYVQISNEYREKLIDTVVELDDQVSCWMAATSAGPVQAAAPASTW